jgi:anthranilate 1,2-dioxygenase small subunit
MHEAIAALHNRYIRVIDDGDLEAWPELFLDDGLYRIITRENFDAGLPLAVMECQGRGMMQDRVTSFRRINVFEPQRYLHQTSGLSIEMVGPFHARCRSNYSVIRTLGDGSMMIFSAGQYQDEIFIRQDRAMFRQRIVIPDSRRVDTLLVIPL